MPLLKPVPGDLVLDGLEHRPIVTLERLKEDWCDWETERLPERVGSALHTNGVQLARRRVLRGRLEQHGVGRLVGITKTLNAAATGVHRLAVGKRLPGPLTLDRLGHVLRLVLGGYRICACW